MDFSLLYFKFPVHYSQMTVCAFKLKISWTDFWEGWHYFLLKPDALTSLKAFTIISGTAIQEQFERILEGRKECSFLTKLSAKEKQVI